MNLTQSLVRFRITVVLALIFVVPIFMAGMGTPAQQTGAVRIGLWVAALFAGACVLWELWRGVSRWRSRRADDSTPTDAGA